jgi:tetratricopeptide (TPR) repeat protein
MRGKAALSDVDGLELAVELPVDNLLALDEALTNLAERDAQAAQPAQLHCFAGLSIDAVVAYRKAVEVDPKNDSACSNLGSALRYQRKLPEAIAAYQQAIKLNPKFAVEGQQHVLDVVQRASSSGGCFARTILAPHRELARVGPTHPMHFRILEGLLHQLVPGQSPQRPT